MSELDRFDSGEWLCSATWLARNKLSSAGLDMPCLLESGYKHVHGPQPLGVNVYIGSPEAKARVGRGPWPCAFERGRRQKQLVFAYSPRAGWTQWLGRPGHAMVCLSRTFASPRIETWPRETRSLFAYFSCQKEPGRPPTSRTPT